MVKRIVRIIVSVFLILLLLVLVLYALEMYRDMTGLVLLLR